MIKLAEIDLAKEAKQRRKAKRAAEKGARDECKSQMDGGALGDRSRGGIIQAKTAAKESKKSGR